MERMQSSDVQEDGSKAGGSEAAMPLDATAIELATGLSIADIETLGSSSSPDVRADIAAKFAQEFDRLARGPGNHLTYDLLKIFCKDKEAMVRGRLADHIKASPHLPSEIAENLARDEIDVATPILNESPVLDDAVIGDIIANMPEKYALAIADRRPLSEGLIDCLVAEKGTKRVVSRLLDNEGAEISEATLLEFREWGQSDPDIADRLQKRPNLPFAFVNQSVIELAQKIKWSSLGTRTMTKFEASQLQGQFEGKLRDRRLSKGDRFLQTYRALRDQFERGLLKPPMLLAFLRDREIDRLECAFMVMTGFELRWVRTLLFCSDRRSLIALCLKAEFNSADYLAFRMALSLADLGTTQDKPLQRYTEKNMKFASDQFERMRADPHQLKRWWPRNAQFSESSEMFSTGSTGL